MSSRLLLAAALAAVALPAAAQDRDPGGASQPPIVLAPVHTSDADARPGPAVRSAPRPPARARPDGRGGGSGAVLRVAVPVAGPLSDRRDPDAPPPRRVAAARTPVTGPLPNGREGGERVAPTAAPEVAVAPAASTAAGPAEGLALSTARPNPTAGPVAVTFRVEAPVDARVSVFDLQGRQVLVAHDGPAAPGLDHRLDLDLSALAAGAYVVVLQAGAERRSQLVQVVR